jgi:hypothetical protein
LRIARPQDRVYRCSHRTSTEIPIRAFLDYETQRKILADKTRRLKERHVRQLGELVIATGADTLNADELAGAFTEAAGTKDAAKREAWAKRGREFFRQRARKPRTQSHGDGARDPANDAAAQPPSRRQGAT